MSHDVATAYACVAYRIMKYEEDMSEEYLGILLETLYGFYTPKEIKKYTRQISYLIHMKL